MKTLTATRDATAQALDTLDAIREAVAAKRMEIAQIEAAPRTIQMAMHAFDQWSARAATGAVDRLRLDLLLHDGHDGSLTLPFAQAPQGGRDASFAAEALLGLLLLANRVPLRQVVESQLSDLMSGREGLTPQTREKKLQQARAELFDAECSEEALARTLEQAGVAVHRRADADPAVVLLADDSLPR